MADTHITARIDGSFGANRYPITIEIGFLEDGNHVRVRLAGRIFGVGPQKTHLRSQVGKLRNALELGDTG